MPIGVALIGAGLFARLVYLPAIDATSEIELRAVYSRSLKSAQSVAPDRDLARYADDADQDLAAMLDRSDITAVIIAVPIVLTAKFVRIALDAGKHVLSEKPIAKDIAEATTLLQWYRSSGVSQRANWSVAENWRYWKSLNYARDQLAALGRIHQLRVQVNMDCRPGFYMWSFFEGSTWRRHPEHQGGTLLDCGVHFAASLRHLLRSDRVTRIAAFASAASDKLPPLDTLDAIFQTEAGTQGVFQLSLTSNLHGTGWEIVGDNGSISVMDATGTVENTTVTTRFKDRDPEVRPIPIEGLGVPDEVLDWGKALATGEWNDRQRPEEALADLELMELMFQSSAEQGMPKVPVHQVVDGSQ
ncbi:glucose-fructose oxidoreductase [Aspergillus campestris IBT 28561]|uniref:Glucose-fructose oxidoreductase n=1 Tax=Aspergillus campestris (strain IBT 28561) TaxID=1392248 RepID=A0A2I1D8H8_ASPC2|nr:glucose-fructose oxidoreductase [Aspergillus campestris IBT 28561]PKY06157.1 glucose-fructose oxidoreductase [Aspergillus campestris IBT 28561]